jgi:hypothetical protein
MTLLEEIKSICKKYRVSPIKLSVSIIPLLVRDKIETVKYNLTHHSHIKQIEKEYVDILEKEKSDV